MMVLIGAGAAGKTTTLKSIRGLPFDPQRSSTRGGQLNQLEVDTQLVEHANDAFQITAELSHADRALLVAKMLVDDRNANQAPDSTVALTTTAPGSYQAVIIKGKTPQKGVGRRKSISFAAELIDIIHYSAEEETAQPGLSSVVASTCLVSCQKAETTLDH
jgi:GTPase SAR1 family protein